MSLVARTEGTSTRRLPSSCRVTPKCRRSRMSTISSSLTAAPRAARARRRAQPQGERRIAPLSHVRRRAGEDDLRLQRLQEPREVAGRGGRERRREALLEARRGIGAQPEPRGRAPDGERVEGRHLEQQAARVAPDLRGQAAHDARERHGLVTRADQQIGGSEGVLLAVEGRDAFPGTRVAHQDALSRQVLGVERVARLAQIEHHEVGEIDQHVDRALAHREQQPLQPGGEASARAPSISSAQVAGTGAGRDADREGRAVARRGQAGVEGAKRRGG